MNVSLPFASPARKQDTTNNNKRGNPMTHFLKLIFQKSCADQQGVSHLKGYKTTQQKWP